MRFIDKLLRDEIGGTAIEYGLILALITLGIVSFLQGMGDQLQTTFSSTSSSMASP